MPKLWSGESGRWIASCRTTPTTPQRSPGSIRPWHFQDLRALTHAARIRQALQKHDDAAYARELPAFRQLRQKIFDAEAKDPGPYIIVGSILIGLAWFAPPADRAAMYRDGRDLLREVPELQKQYFEKLPPHMRGELWAQIAYASDRLGESAERDRVLNEMLARLGGSPYEARARAWLKEPELANEKQYLCISCHEPGRLAPTLARLQANK
jgi:hypothetical protein